RSADAVQGRQRLRQGAVLLLAPERGEAVAESRPRDRDQREERDEENQEELRSEAQPREHAVVSANPLTRLNQPLAARTTGTRVADRSVGVTDRYRSESERQRRIISRGAPRAPRRS